MTSSSDNVIRIMLVDPHTLFRAGARMLLESRVGFHVVAETGECSTALSLAASHQPDIVLVEVAGVFSDDLDFVLQLLDQVKRARIILVTGENNQSLFHQAAKLGVMGVVLKDQPPDVLFKAITKVHAGEVWFDRATIANVLNQISRTPKVIDPEAEKIASLSSREREVIALVGAGLKNQQIADKLSLSEITVRHHLTSVFGKLGVSDRLELIIYAYQHNLAHLPD